MIGLDKTGVDKLLLQLEEGGFIDSRYRFCKVNNELRLFGRGGFSYVYEMYDVKAPERHYAAKVIGLGTKPVDENFILETTQIQCFLGEQTDNILRVIALWMMKLNLDEDGNIQGVIGLNENKYQEETSFPVQIVLMEKLDSIISKDKYGNVTLLRDDLKKEEGVIKFAKDIGEALFTVHNNGFLHRDIKLENIFWDHNLRQYKLGDFGIAKYVGDGDAETIAFTDGYGAPEIEKQLVCSYNVTADIYSFGITLFLWLNDLKFPASDGYFTNVVQYTKDFVVPAPAKGSEGMAKIIRKMCRYQAEERYQSIEEVLTDIDRIDERSTEQTFFEYDDLQTETYCEDDDSATETYRDPTDNEEQDEINKDFSEDISWLEKDYSELNREERKKKAQFEKIAYTTSSILRMCIAVVLFLLLFKSFSPDASYVGCWQFWILPVTLFVESILQKIKEFDIGFGIVSIGVSIFSMFVLGIDVPQVVMILVILLRIPIITAGCAIGTGLWIAQMLSGKLSWLGVFAEWDLGWIILICFAALINSYVLLSVNYNKSSSHRYFVLMWLLDKIWCVMIIAGIILLILECLGVIAIPEILKHIHLIRVGIGIMAVELFYSWLC